MELLARLLEQFDIQNPSAYLGNMKAIAGALNAQSQGQNTMTAGLLTPPPLSPYPGQQMLDPLVAPLIGIAA